ncbi:hypothetical protein FOZ60_000627 [Perkinsus olseni]|uniref:DDE Tnp4 domain-containing protein n=1 Tax=Perkinsus olseni TaxID=32597 RepID=A0A7J6MZ75_PEROL|nr:hypothetical protein FOZ60_000627 [Perkinsus olseni]
MAVVNTMCPLYIAIPTGPELQDSIDGFRDICGMMDVWGVVDGTHVVVHPPSQFEDSYLNRHHQHSFNCQIVCTYSLRICNLSCRWGGSVHDSRVFRNSTIGRRVEAGWRPDNLNVVVLGDSAYRSSAYLRTPFSRAGGRILDAAQQEFNGRHRRGRTVVERCIGVLKSQFRCLKDLRIRGRRETAGDSMELTANAIRACVALRNFIIVHRVEQQEDVDSDVGGSTDSEND